jgi:predicted CoA-binding protein
MERKTIETILNSYNHIAVVGLSERAERPSNRVAKYLMQHGYTIYPVNPNLNKVLGLNCYASLSSIPPELRKNIEIVNIFRNPEEVEPIVDEAISIGAKVIWMQSGISNKPAADKARLNGLLVIENRCIAVDHQTFVG